MVWQKENSHCDIIGVDRKVGPSACLNLYFHRRELQMIMQYLLTGESVPVNNVFTAKALLDSSSLHNMQELGNLKRAGNNTVLITR